MFCGYRTEFGAEPDAQVCPVCLGLPAPCPSPPGGHRGDHPHRTRADCRIAEWCRFARKNYFYPDMPKNFQISPVRRAAVRGRMARRRGRWRDRARGHRARPPRGGTGKTLHVGGATGRIHGAAESLVDYNRAGIPLVEIVTKPIPGTGALAPVVARTYVTELRDLVRGLGALRRADRAGLVAVRREHIAEPARPGVGHPYRNEERQLTAQRRARRAVGDDPAGEHPRKRWPDRPGDAAFPRGDGRHDTGAQQGGGDRLSVLPRTRPRATCAGPGLGWRSCGRHCPSRPASTGSGCRIRGASRTGRCRLR